MRIYAYAHTIGDEFTYKNGIMRNKYIKKLPKGVK